MWPKMISFLLGTNSSMAKHDHFVLVLTVIWQKMIFFLSRKMITFLICASSNMSENVHLLYWRKESHGQV
jgi:hypothetical protein